MNALAPIPASEARLPAAYEQAKVYFVSDTRRVKIGTSRDPRHRLTQLQVGNPERLTIIRVIDGDSRAEAWLHRHYAHRRISGEWFRFCPTMFDVRPPEFVRPIADAPAAAVDQRPLVEKMLEAHSLGLMSDRDFCEMFGSHARELREYVEARTETGAAA